jgi:hypothetical protein
VFDFRYHALSLVAVFLALAVGLLLGTAIGDSGLVSSAKQDIEKSLRSDVRKARAESADLSAELGRRGDYEQQTYPDLVANRLPGQQIGLIFLGGSSDAIVNDVRTALDPTSATLRWVGVLREPPDVAGLGSRARATRYQGLSSDPSLLEPFAERMGIQLVMGGNLVKQERASLMRSFSGDLGTLSAVIVVRSPDRPKESSEQRGQVAALEDGLVRGIERANVPAVGIETLDTDPSQVGWYRDHGLASVDSVDVISGHAALVFALAGADGAFGLKPSAEALLPRVVGGVPRP